MFRLFAIALCSLMLAGPAKAHDEGFVVGWISGVDRLSDEIILDDGKIFVASPYINFEMLSPGRRVMLEFISGPSGRTAVEVIPLPQIELLEQAAGAV